MSRTKLICRIWKRNSERMEGKFNVNKQQLLEKRMLLKLLETQFPESQLK